MIASNFLSFYEGLENISKYFFNLILVILWVWIFLTKIAEFGGFLLA